MKVLLFILFLPLILLVVIPVGGALIGVGAAIFGVILGIFGAIFGVIVAIFATIFGGIGSLIGWGVGILFSNVFIALIIALIIYSFLNRAGSHSKVTKS